MICKNEMIIYQVFEAARIAQSIENRRLKNAKLFKCLVYNCLKRFSLFLP